MKPPTAICILYSLFSGRIIFRLPISHFTVISSEILVLQAYSKIINLIIDFPTKRKRTENTRLLSRTLPFSNPMDLWDCFILKITAVTAVSICGLSAFIIFCNFIYMTLRDDCNITCYSIQIYGPNSSFIKTTLIIFFVL
jgi:hypothetical protein